MGVRVGQLWINNNDEGNTFVSGWTGPIIIPQNSKIYLNKNTNKKDNDKSPDYYLDVVEPRTRPAKEEYVKPF